MKPIKVMTTAALATLLLSVGAISAFAEEVGSYPTKGEVKFEASDEGTNPTDPTDPTKPVDPVDPDGENPEPGTPGPLSIDFASSFDFGEQKISSQDEEYYAAAQKLRTEVTGEYEYVPNYVQVTDNRGTEAGWTLSVKKDDDIVSTEDESHTLKGAEIVISGIEPVTASDSKLASDGVKSEIILGQAGSTDVVMNAEPGEGAGTHLAVFGSVDEDDMNINVVLKVPGSITKYKETYETSLTWTLSDIPGNGDEEEPDPDSEGPGDEDEDETR